LATLVDTVLLAIFITLPLAFIYGPQEYFFGEQIFLGFWDVVLGYITPVILTIWFWLGYQATPGKILLKLQIVDANTMTALTVWQAIGRYLGYLVSLVVFLMGFFWIAFDQRKQGWHDKLAGTFVIKKPVSMDYKDKDLAG